MIRSPFEILKKPRITEKGSRMAEGVPVYFFEVPRDVNKIEIKNAVQRAFGVQVVSVRTQIVRGKIKRRGKRMGKRPNWKKAVVRLVEGHNIDVFGGSVASTEGSSS